MACWKEHFESVLNRPEPEQVTEIPPAVEWFRYMHRSAYHGRGESCHQSDEERVEQMEWQQKCSKLKKLRHRAFWCAYSERRFLMRGRPDLSNCPKRVRMRKCKKAGFVHIYTPQCIRATSETVLKAAGLENCRLSKERNRPSKW